MKKIYTILSILIVCSVIFVSAELITTYFERQVEISVTQPIIVGGSLIQDISGMSGEMIIGEPITIKNIADWDIDVQIVSNNNPLEIEVAYDGIIETDLTISQNSNLTFTPMYFILPTLATGNYQITTSVNPA